MPKLDLEAIPQTNATGYPPQYADKVCERWYRRLAPAGGIEDFGVSHVELKPGAWSSQRHWHEGEDEFVVMLSGEAVLVDDSGRTPMRAGDCAAFPKGDQNGHVLINESAEPCIFIAVGRVAETDCHYPDIDMHLDASVGRQRRKDGSEFDRPEG
ncbi:MAG: cupin domain-containing protein [Parasphingopyxis sp.]|nr:cupin domain-containing protein [Sphingomonadales bacterium]